MNLVLASIAGIGFAMAGLAVLLGIRIGPRVRGLSAAVASGILLAVSFAELLPEAIEQAGDERAVLGFLAGFAALFVVESATRSHTHHGHDDDDGGTVAHAMLPFLLGLGIHNFADGFAIGASGRLSGEAAGTVALGVLIHQLPVGVSFAAVLAAGGARRALVVRAAVALGAAIPLGAAVVMALPPGSPSAGATMGAAAGGGLAYIAAGHLLPEAHREHASVLVALGFLGALAVTTALVWHVLDR